MVLLANSTLFLRGLRMNSNQMQGSYRRRQSLRVIRHAWFRHLLIQGCLAAGSIGLGVIFQGNCDAQDSFRSAPPKAWRQAGPWRAIGIGPAKETASNTPDQGLVQKASAEELARGSEKPAGVVNAIATTESRQPSLVRVPSISIEPPKPLQADQSSSDRTATEISTSRSVGAKVKLSASVISEGSSSNEPGKSSTTNSSNLRVTRSGDITAETPVKVNFNQERIIALPALPSPASPYAETGIEIPVRVESLAETVQSIIETQTPMADLPAVPIHSVSEVQIQLERPPMLESPEVIDKVETQVDEPQTDDAQEPGLQESGLQQSSLQETATEELRKMVEDEVTAAETAAMTPAIAPSLSVATDPSPQSPVVAAPTIMALPSVDATPEEIQAISSLNRSSQAKTDGVLSQPGAQVLITAGPMSIPGEVEATEKVFLESQDIRALQVTGTICRLHVIDSSVCQVVCNGNRLFIVADQTGETMIEVNMGKLHKPMYVKVVVQRPWARSSSASVSLEQMQAIVTRLAPTADVTVQANEEGSLVVKGIAENNQQAKKVLEAIRKMVLVPVIDRIEIR
jgi:hypothetical protein